MTTSVSLHRGLPLPAAISGAKRLVDIRAIKDALIALDIDINKLRKNTSEAITIINCGGASGGGYVQTLGLGIDYVPSAGGGGGDMTVGSTSFVFNGPYIVPANNAVNFVF